jgi:Autographiviridae HNH endonuclease
MTPCIEWNRGRTAKGYPEGPSRFGTRYVHRQVMAEKHGVEAIRGKVVMHSCDNPSCVNPDHLSIGSQRANIVDSMLKGRYRKLGPDEVREIRDRYAAGDVLQRELADEFGVSQRAISMIVLRQKWEVVS